MNTVQENVQKTIENKPKELVEQLERHKAEQEKETVEDEARAHLRGFSRTIPSFIMAYGGENLTLANFDNYTEDDVFLEVTGITEEDFRFLSDGGEYENTESGEMEYFEGHLFDEVVFNDSIEEFWKKKQQLANYFDESLEEDIFDYIPPQKTNQYFAKAGVWYGTYPNYLSDCNQLYFGGGDEDLKAEVHNFIEADAAEAAKKGEMQVWNWLRKQES